MLALNIIITLQLKNEKDNFQIQRRDPGVPLPGRPQQARQARALSSPAQRARPFRAQPAVRQEPDPLDKIIFHPTV
jgi:hypothetical protein